MTGFNVAPATDEQRRQYEHEKRQEFQRREREIRAEFEAEQSLGHDGAAAGAPQQRRRPSAREVLLQKVHDLRWRAQRLEALADQIPAVMTPKAAEGLIDLLVSSR